MAETTPIMTTITSASIQETAQFSRSVLDALMTAAAGATSATVLALSGELGAGKTAFVKTVAQHLGIAEEITSPTFIIEKIYRLSTAAGPFKKLIHIDAYRLESGKELSAIGWDDIVSNPSNLICIEWPEKVADVIPPHAKRISFEFVDEKTRMMKTEI